MPRKIPRRLAHGKKHHLSGCISIFWQVRESRLKMRRSPFDTLRANGGRADGIEDCPFVLSLSKHGHRQARTMPESGYAPHLSPKPSRMTQEYVIIPERNKFLALPQGFSFSRFGFLPQSP